MPQPNRAVAIRAECAARDSNDYLFPPQVFRPWPYQPDDAPRVYYGLFFRAMDEPSLSCGNGQPDTYRLTLLTYTGVPLSVRIVRDNTITLSWTKLEAPAWMLPPGQVMGRGITSVQIEGWHDLEAALDTAGFWSMSTDQTPSSEQDDPGTAWIMEGRRARHYQVVVRSSPGDTPYRQAGLVFLRLAGITEEELESNAPGVIFRPFRQPPHIPGLPAPPEPPPPPPPKTR